MGPCRNLLGTGDYSVLTDYHQGVPIKFKSVNANINVSHLGGETLTNV